MGAETLGHRKTPSSQVRIGSMNNLESMPLAAFRTQGQAKIQEMLEKERDEAAKVETPQ